MSKSTGRHRKPMRSGKKRSAQQSAMIEVPKTWEDVATIDFTGYLDRDCEERIIYKTPEGTLKAAIYDPGIIGFEDVTREQVTRWIQQCIIPKEFEHDFAVRSKGKHIADNDSKSAWMGAEEGAHQ